MVDGGEPSLPVLPLQLPVSRLVLQELSARQTKHFIPAKIILEKHESINIRAVHGPDTTAWKNLPGIPKLVGFSNEPLQLNFRPLWGTC